MPKQLCGDEEEEDDSEEEEELELVSGRPPLLGWPLGNSIMEADPEG